MNYSLFCLLNYLFPSEAILTFIFKSASPRCGVRL